MDVAGIRYTGAVPGADSNTYTLFSTDTAFPGAWMAQGAGYKRIFGGINNPQAGTLNLYYSLDRGTNWVLVSTAAIADSTASAINSFDFLIEAFPDFKVEWVNGGVAQTGWTVTLSLASERAAAV